MFSNGPASARRIALPGLRDLFRQPRRVLRNPNYRLYFIGQLISQCGGWMQRVALSWLVLDLTGSSVALGVVTALQFGPILFLSLFSGVISDRFSKRSLLAVTQVALMIQAFLLAGLVLGGAIQLWQVYLLALWLGVASAFDWPARQAFVGEMVTREELRIAVAINSSVFNAARIIGPGVGGIILAVWGAGWCFLANGLSFAAMLVGLALMRSDSLHPHHRAEAEPFWQQLVDGIRHAARNPKIALPLLVLGFLGTFGYNFGVTLPLLARYELQVGAVGFGAMNTALGVGAVVGALIVASYVAPAPRTILLAAGAFGGLLLGVALAPWYPLALVLLVILGLASVTYSASSNAAVQLGSAEEFRGRTLSLYALLSSGTAPIGGALTGFLADVWGIRITMAFEAGLCILGAGMGVLFLRHFRAKTGPQLAR